MGAIHFSIDIKLVHALQSALPVHIFVETGTFKGDTSLLASSYFKQVFTIEASDALFIAARERLQHLSNIELVHGSSPNILRNLSITLSDQSAIYWLDAHWCGSVTAGENHECPILDELEAIGNLNSQSVILIDDARLFIAPPPRPHNPDEWPRIDILIDRLRRLSHEHSLWIINDVIIFAPLAISEHIVAYGVDQGFDLCDMHSKAAKELPRLLLRNSGLIHEIKLLRSNSARDRG